MTSPVPMVPTEGDTYARRHAESLIDWTTFWDADFQTAEWCVEPFLPEGRLVALYSPGGAGKSLLLLDVLARVATGQRVFDQAAATPRRVLYFDLEMTEGDLYERLGDMGYGPETDLSHLYYQLLPNLPPLDTPAGGEAVVALAREYQAEIVAFDTTSRVISGKENDSDTLLALYRHTGRPLKEMGCTVVRLDHAGKDLDRGQRGSSAKNDDVDLVWELRPREGGVVLVAKKRRQTWIPEHIEIVRREEPLRHELAIAGATWPGGTEACAQALDRLGIELNASTRGAQQALREAGEGARREIVTAAMKYRRHLAEQAGTTGNHFGTTIRNHPEPDSEPPRNHPEPPGTTAGTTFLTKREPLPGTTESADSGTTPEPPGTADPGEREPPRISRDTWGSPPTAGICTRCREHPADAGEQWPELCDECATAEFNNAVDNIEGDEPWWT